MKKGIGLIGMFLVGGLLLACPSPRPRVIASADTTGTAYTVAAAPVPITFSKANGTPPDICRLSGEIQISADELVLPTEGPAFTNIPSFLSENCLIGFGEVMGDEGFQRRSFDYDCFSAIPFDVQIGDLDVSTFEDTDPGSYVVDVVTATSYRCSDSLAVPQTGLVDGLITVN